MQIVHEFMSPYPQKEASPIFQEEQEIKNHIKESFGFHQFQK